MSYELIPAIMRPDSEPTGIRIRLITRGDDAGCSHSANRALVECCEQGVLRNVSVMVPGPAFNDAVRLFAGRDDVCLGLHATLSAEWEFPKWGPVLPHEKVPSLVEANGHFTTHPGLLRDRGVSAEEAIAEVQAQLDTARRHGLHISYLDEHMSVGLVTGLGERLAELCLREHLICAATIPWLPNPQSRPANFVEWWVEQLRHVTPGTYALVSHPVHNDEEMRAFYGRGMARGEIARRRDGIRRGLIDPSFRHVCRELGVEFIRYDDARIGT